MNDLAVWTTLFVDMVGSTEMKYKYADRNYVTVGRILDRLWESIDESSANAYVASMKFTGDGAMIVFRREPNGCGAALSVAEKISLAIERANLQLNLPTIRVRVGVTTGESRRVPGFHPIDLIGRPVDLAARLCAEADPDTILIDRETKDAANRDPYRFPEHRFVRCDRRLSLKGIPVDPTTPDEFYFLRVNRLLNFASPETFTEGLLAVFPDRATLQRHWSPARIIHRAAGGSTVLVAGRTLTNWTRFSAEMRYAASERDVHFRFLLSSESACRFLLDDQQIDVQKDLPRAVECFSELAARDARFEVKTSDHLIIDGITCATVLLAGDRDPAGTKLIALQDVNVGNAQNKSSQLWGCTCAPDNNRMAGCPAHGLLERTEHIYGLARPPVTPR